MKKNKQKDHPEVTDIKHICDISPKTKFTKGVCEKVNLDTKKKNLNNNEKPKNNP